MRKNSTPQPIVIRCLMGSSLWIGMLVGCAIAWWAPLSLRAESEPREFFEKQVRPILATHCYECHSAKADKLQAGLRVDSRNGLLRGGDSGPAVVAGEPDESLLISAVRYESFEMPPRGKLSADQIATLRRWVQEGAWWPPEETDSAAPAETAQFDWRARQQSHWAWQPLGAASPPATPDTPWARAPIDRFVLARLDEAGLTPSPRADACRLVRRLYLDLIGLPPTPEQVRQFVGQPAEAAYRQLVDQLLESPHFGEKWARHWMDLVRYAETCGHEFDYPIPHAHRYRDYLIRAFNEDVPYDQLVREHVAGDLLSPPRRHPQTGTNESIVGTSFWFLGEAVHAPTDVRGDEADRIDNQIDVFGKAFLGMTIGCARCHDHKFDPIPTTDYYALAGFLQSSRRQEALLDPHGVILEQIAAIAARRARGGEMLFHAAARHDESAGAPFAANLLAAQAQLSARKDGTDLSQESTDADERVQRFVAALQDPEIQSPQHPLYAWYALSQDDDRPFLQRRDELANQLSQQQRAYETAMGKLVTLADFRRQDFNGWFVTGWAFGEGPTERGQWDGPETLPGLTHPGLAHSGRWGRAAQGVLRSPTFTLEQGQIHYRMKADNVQLRLIVDGYVMDIYNALLFADVTLEDVSTQGQFRWVTQHRDLNHYLGHRAHLEVIDRGDGYAAIEGIYFSDDGPPPEPIEALNLRLLGDLQIRSLNELAGAYERCLRDLASGESTAGSIPLGNWAFKWQLVPLPDGWDSLAAEVDALQKALPAPLPVTAMADGTGENERVHIRGNHRNLGERVARRPPVVLAGATPISDEHGSGRLGLADALVSSDNPLLSRVIVNRLWHHLLGRGIVPTVDDLGAMGQPPSHPDLLDWLARDLITHGWSLKHTIRQIVLSNTYQQTAQLADAATEAADPENRWWHRAPVKRLTAEAIRDSMLAISGRFDPQVFGPSVPVHLTAFMTGRGRPPSGPSDGEGRRSIYIRVQRNFLSPMMLTFDMPAPFSTMGRRSVSNVPAQSLILMNDEFVWQQARRWAERLQAESADPDERLEQLFMYAWARPPHADERARLRRFIDQQAARQGESTDGIRVWTDACHALWNTKEFLYSF